MEFMKLASLRTYSLPPRKILWFSAYADVPRLNDNKRIRQLVFLFPNNLNDRLNQ